VLEKFALNRMGKSYDPSLARLGNTKHLIKRFQRIFDDKIIDIHSWVEWSIYKKYFFEVGTIGEPFQPADEQFGATKGLLDLFKAYKYPLYVCTKGNLLITNEKYYDALVDLKKSGLIVDVSLISNQDDLIRKYEPRSPLASERMKLIKRLCDDGVNVTISARPILMGVTDVKFKEFITELCQTGIQSIHLRKIYITGWMLRDQMWKDYIAKYKEKLNRHGAGYVGGNNMDFFPPAIEIARQHDVTITGSNALFFELEGSSNKMNYEKIDGEAKKHLFPYTILPLYNKIRQNIDTPQVLKFSESMDYIINAQDNMLDAEIKIDSATQQLIDCYCSQSKHRIPGLMNVRKLLLKSMWDGWENWSHIKKYMTGTRRIRVIMNGGKAMLDEEGHPMYFYNPKDKTKEREVEYSVVKGVMGNG